VCDRRQRRLIRLHPFSIIYSSGTTGAPKGIVQSHRMRWAHVRRAGASGYDATAITICSTPPYSNTTLVSFFPALAAGGAVVLMSKFDAAKFCAEWGETPVAFIVLKPGRRDSAESVRAWANERLGRMQRLAAIEIAANLPRSAIGKVLKRELRERWAGRV
jgi:acyl-CoA synthetase (AMP-forming)/AMP-acid ligase II